ncbi:hypothetical protein Cgig2_021208 [Carnegiea gigantea]|uniref:LIM zinc-binding domain-containing protein n=1 Tax=Carnegiea gigantea TaxID=171969 RepID=A0A9Q1QR89_9CARY|nr:hypothetical protein Cgig2_021208 [Carnegiea gigantea]
MGWLSKIFKGSNHEVVEEHNYDGYAEDPIRNTSSTSGEPYVQHEDEDIARAIALSLLEAEQKGKSVLGGTSIVNSEEKPQLLSESAMKENPENSMSASLVDSIFTPAISSPVNPQSEVPCLPHIFYLHLVIGNRGEELFTGCTLSFSYQATMRYLNYESQIKEDEELARALQESLKVESPPRYGYGNGSIAPQPISIPYPTGYRICAGCHSEIGYGRFLSCMGGFWHPECFTCHACNSPISGYEVTLITDLATKSSTIQNVEYAGSLLLVPTLGRFDVT